MGDSSHQDFAAYASESRPAFADRFSSHAGEIWSGFALALITLVVIGTVSLLSTIRYARSASMVTRAYIVIAQLESLEQRLTAAESSTRGYIIVGDAHALVPLTQVRSTTVRTVAEIRGMLSDAPPQIERLAGLEAAINQRLDLMSQVLAVYNSRGQRAAIEFLQSNRTGKAEAEVNRRITAMVDAERTMLSRRDSVEESSVRIATSVIVYGSLAAFAFIVFAGFYIYQALRSLRATTLLAERSARSAQVRGRELAHQTETARRAEAGFRNLLESATDAILTVNSDGEITYANRRASEHFGYSHAELIGLQVDRLVPEAARRAHRSHRNAYQRAPKVRTMAPSLALTALRKNGSEFSVEVSLSPIESDIGPQVLTTIRDMTEYRHAQEYRAQISALVEASRYALVSYTQAGIVLTWNRGAQRLYGWAPDEMIGRNVSILIPEQGIAEHVDQIARIAAGAGLQECEATRRCKDGQPVEVAVSKSPIYDTRGNLVAISTISYDITERMRTERELRERTQELARSNAELEQFAYVASHDLQEPLRMVASYLQLLSKRYEGRLDKDADDFINFAVEGAMRMKQLINDLLDYSRAGRGPEPRPVELSRALERALASLALTVEENHAALMVDALPRVMGDEARLAEVFQNLISNSLKFRSTEAPRIRIGAAREDGCWTISVSDNGIGIDPEYKERIFVMFQRLHGREEYSGTGIGLAICKRIIERIGGRIWAESGSGCGATFRFTLPAVAEGAGGQEASGESGIS
jgi:PAS domain S-box-containing protein